MGERVAVGVLVGVGVTVAFFRSLILWRLSVQIVTISRRPLQIDSEIALSPPFKSGHLIVDYQTDIVSPLKFRP